MPDFSRSCSHRASRDSRGRNKCLSHAKKLKSQLNLEEIKNWNDLDSLNTKIDFSSNIESKEVLFRKIEDDEIIRQIEKLKKMSNQ